MIRLFNLNRCEASSKTTRHNTRIAPSDAESTQKSRFNHGGRWRSPETARRRCAAKGEAPAAASAG